MSFSFLFLLNTFISKPNTEMSCHPSRSFHYLVLNLFRRCKVAHLYFVFLFLGQSLMYPRFTSIYVARDDLELPILLGITRMCHHVSSLKNLTKQLAIMIRFYLLGNKRVKLIAGSVKIRHWRWPWQTSLSFSTQISKSSHIQTLFFVSSLPRLYQAEYHNASDIKANISPYSKQLFHGSQHASCQINPTHFYKKITRQREENTRYMIYLDVNKAGDKSLHSSFEEKN